MNDKVTKSAEQVRWMKRMPAKKMHRWSYISERQWELCGRYSRNGTAWNIFRTSMLAVAPIDGVKMVLEVSVIACSASASRSRFGMAKTRS